MDALRNMVNKDVDIESKKKMEPKPFHFKK